eukprot:8800631-Pyramimonas_sp.AAC.1
MRPGVGMVDLPAEATTATFGAVTLPDNYAELDLSTAQAVGDGENRSPVVAVSKSQTRWQCPFLSALRISNDVSIAHGGKASHSTGGDISFYVTHFPSFGMSRAKIDANMSARSAITLQEAPQGENFGSHHEHEGAQ